VNKQELLHQVGDQTYVVEMLFGPKICKYKFREQIEGQTSHAAVLGVEVNHS
jgi:hypothetical protein